ncbi:MAG: hypothetical protein ACI4F7_01490 [Acutalibacteraceae bacterium]
MNYLPYIVTALSIIGTVANSLQKRWCFWIWIFGHDVCAVLANLSRGNITYKVHYKGGKWLPEVKNRNDYAGLFNRPIDGLMMKTDTGVKIYYRVHLRRKNKWLSWISGYSERDAKNGYAGILGQEIDAIQIKF